MALRKVVAVTDCIYMESSGGLAVTLAVIRPLSEVAIGEYIGEGGPTQIINRRDFYSIIIDNDMSIFSPFNHKAYIHINKTVITKRYINL